MPKYRYKRYGSDLDETDEIVFWVNSTSDCVAGDEYLERVLATAGLFSAEVLG